ncbi:hypothetical protein LCGC14_0632110 [marine sediment metagenome]|uniref:Uncharacterized protein n=1 Tax=marine sediment metagenome TaxID=412755 RepID=A0A0F9TN26_9ZZZZ
MIKKIWGLICRLHYGEYGGVGATVSTADAITAAKMNLKLEDVDDADLGTITEIALTPGTNPAGSVIFIAADNTNDIRLNALTGGDISFSINATDIVEISATEVEITAGVDIQFLGNDGILDSAGNEVILVEAVGSAINYLNVKNAATGNPIILECLGTADRGFILQNDQDEEILILTPVASADTELTILNAAAGSPIIRSSGTADKGVIFQNAASEPTFQVAVAGSAPVNWLTTKAGDTGVAVVLANDGEVDVGFEFHAKDGEEILILSATAAAINEITITSKAAGEGATIEATGGDTHISIVLVPKGNGVVAGSNAANGNLLLGSTNHATKGFVGIPTGHEGLKVGGTADRAGTVGDNVVHVFNGAAAPAGALANGCSFYSEAGEMKVLDAAGNSTTLSPHTPDGDFIINSYSAMKEKTVRVHLEKLINALVERDPSLAEFIEYLEIA